MSERYRTVAERASATFEVQGSEFIGHVAPAETVTAAEAFVAVVTRYYGGTNLGVGGLARSYSRAVRAGVDAAGVVESVPHERFAVTVAYDDSGSVRSLLESADVEFDASYEADVTFAVRVPAAEGSHLRDRIRSATSGRADIDY